MHELVHHTFYSRLLSALRLPSFAGEGLPERMRSISFALLGLTAAAGLGLVAIFAQPGFTLLSPAPLPDQPSVGEAVAEAKKLPVDHRLPTLVPAPPAQPRQTGASSSPGAPFGGSPKPSGGGNAGSSPGPSAGEAPAPVVTPGPSVGNGGAGAQNGTGGGSSPSPPAAPEKAPASTSAPASAPQPPTPTPEATTSASRPEPASAPGHSSSAAAAAHASQRGIEASASSGPPASSSPAASVAPESAPPPGNGNGLAKGHYK